MVDTNNFDPNTGKQLTPGQTVLNKETGKNVTQGTPFGSGTVPISNSVSPLPTGKTFGVNADPANQFQFANVLQTGIDRMNAITPLANARQLLYKQLYDTPLSPDEMSKLPPEYQTMVQTGNKQEVEMGMRLLNDTISGRMGTMDQSVQFLAKQYSDSQANLQTQRQGAIDSVIKFVGQYGSQAPAAMKALYGQSYLDQLKAQGIDINTMASLPTINQTKYGAQYGYSSGGTGSYDLSTYNLDPNYSNTINSISSQIGSIASSKDAQTYISQVNPTSPITGEMVMNASNHYGIDPTTMMALMQQESGFGTSPVATKNNNVGGITWTQAYQDAHPGSSKGGARPPAEGGNYVHFNSLQDGVNAQAQWLANNPSQTAIQTIAQGTIDGSVPPPVSSRGTITPTTSNLKLEAAILAKGGNLTKIALDWGAMQKWLTSANSGTQLRLRQAIDSVKQGIEGLRSASSDWNAGGFAPLNSANMKAALNGAYGQQAQSIAAKFQQQATIITDELGQTFMGGNSPTDAALSLAGKTLDTNWSKETLDGALTNLDTNLGYRLNAIQSTGPMGAGGSSDNMYNTGSTNTYTTSSEMTLMTGPDGNQYNVPNANVDAFTKAGGKKS